MSVDPSPTPKRPRKRNDDRNDIPASVFPEGNPHARRAYLCALLGIIPIVGLFTGPFAVLFGWLGYRVAKTLPNQKTIGHAVVSMLLGVLEMIFNSLGVYFLARGLNWI